MDVISKKDTLQAIYNIHHWSEQANHEPESDELCVYDNVLSAVYDVPSAFEGMTNGQVIQALFPDGQMISADSGVIEYATVQANIMVSRDFWDSPYQKGGK